MTLLAVCSLSLAGNARAASPSLLIELVDPDPIGVRVQIPNMLAGKPCHGLNDVTVFEGVLKPSKPIAIAHDVAYFCVRQTFAPFTQVAWSAPRLITRVFGEAPILIQLHSRDVSVVPSSGPLSTLATPLTVTLKGEGRIGVRIAAGTKAPCAVAGNAPIYSGVLEPSKPLSFPTSAVCICYEQTSTPFVTAGFGPSQIHCRPQTCVALTSCKPDLTKPFALRLLSKPVGS